MQAHEAPLAVRVANAHADIFPEEFRAWLPANVHVYAAFEREALRVIARGFKHYSSKTVIEFLRHHSALTERDSDWKLNNNHTPYLPRLFDRIHPDHVGLWEYRETKKTHTEDAPI